MSVKFVWEEKYSVGDPVIDEQHKGLFAIGNSLPETANADDIKPLIMRLFKYTREHFLAEEQMMQRIGFPLLDEHRMLHEDLITKLNETSAQPLDTDDAVNGFKKFVFEWLTDHIMVQDKKYFQFSQRQK